MKHSQDILCPHCSSSDLQKNGHSENGTQRWRCIHCHKSFQLIYRYDNVIGIYIERYYFRTGLFRNAA